MLRIAILSMSTLLEVCVCAGCTRNSLCSTDRALRTAYVFDSVDAERLASMIHTITPWPLAPGEYRNSDWQRLVEVASVVQRTSPVWASGAINGYLNHCLSDSEPAGVGLDAQLRVFLLV